MPQISTQEFERLSLRVHDFNGCSVSPPGIANQKSLRLRANPHFQSRYHSREDRWRMNIRNQRLAPKGQCAVLLTYLNIAS
jgi:hypothetical protein